MDNLKEQQKETKQNDRRDFIKKAAYAAPVILTMAATPSFASSGSGHATHKVVQRRRPPQNLTP